MCASTSVLSELEPLFGASFAINLAYLNLNQFRYRDVIAAKAKLKLSDAPSTVHSTQWFKEIQSLADQTDGNETKLRLPATPWGWIYRPLFHWRFDKIFSVAFTAISAVYLYLGVAHSVGMFPHFQAPFTSSEIGNELTYATLGLCWPMLMVLSAKFCTSRCQKFIEYQLNDIKKSELASGADDIDSATKEIDAKQDIDSQ